MGAKQAAMGSRLEQLIREMREAGFHPALARSEEGKHRVAWIPMLGLVDARELQWSEGTELLKTAIAAAESARSSAVQLPAKAGQTT